MLTDKANRNSRSHRDKREFVGRIGWSLVLILVWIYYSSLIFLLGAEFTRIHSRRYRDGRAKAEPGAVRVETVQVPVEASTH